HDHRLDLRLATFDRSWDCAHAASPEGLGLLHSFQHRGRDRLCLSLCPSHLSTVVGRARSVARSLAGRGDARGCSSAGAPYRFGPLSPGSLSLVKVRLVYEKDLTPTH